VRPPQSIRALWALIHLHRGLLWWGHSLYALALGVGFMWVGSRHHTFLRIAGFHIVFIWTTSLVLARASRGEETIRPWWRWLRLGINYVNKNFYQQILFFILPIYYASATGWSRNMTFVALLAVSAVLSTIDVIYDRHLSTRPLLSASFFAFNLFACVNVALPVLWSISNATSLRVATVSAVVGFVSIARRPSEFARRATWMWTGVGAVVVLFGVDLSRPLIPPAPLRLANTSFGLSLDRRAFRLNSPVETLSSDWSGRVYAVTGLLAPLGLRDNVVLHWYRDGRPDFSSTAHDIVGGRSEGYLLWTSTRVATTTRDTALRLEVVTESGQLIGRADLTTATR
jgi:heme/copper-type cytochrome/quinol oxidase subunit 4